MDLFRCVKNISLCLNFYNLTLCPLENNICVENHGYCVFNKENKSQCLCLPCFTGEYCEQERVSKNLWFIGILVDALFPDGKSITPIICIVFYAFLVFNGILCLQTYLCKNIRETNVGIYLIMLSIVSICIGLLHLIFPSIGLHIKQLPQPYLFADLYCLIYNKHVSDSLGFMYHWFITSVAIERMLIECFEKYDLHDSTRRSKIFSAVIVIISPLTTLPGVFTVRQHQIPELISVQCINYTHLGYILYETINCIHLFAFGFIYIVMNAVVLGHLLRHRRRFAADESLPTQVLVVLRKHKDFLVPYLILALCYLPNVMMSFLMTCPEASTILVARLNLAFCVLQIAPFLITFYLYIYLAPVYWLEFWNSSPIGKCLMTMKKKFQTVCSCRNATNDNLSELRS